MSAHDQIIRDMIDKGLITREQAYKALGMEMDSQGTNGMSVSGNGQDSVLEFGTSQRPMVTREQYEQGRKVLDALPPGIYIHCCECRGWTVGGTVHLTIKGPLCERCAR